ncbi:MAG: hypothetical protein RL215_1299 [Planctomycetota bacterium]|jgi:hypothetical protein
MKFQGFVFGLATLAIAGNVHAWQGAPVGKLIRGTKGADTLYAHAISGEPAIVQDYENFQTATGPNGETLRGDDPGDPVQGATRTYFRGQSYDDHLKTMIGGQGADKFIIKTYISGKPAVVARHVNDDGTINWGGVAGENEFVHDHWTEFIGYVQINDFSRQQGDQIQVRGHTVALKSITVVNGDSLVVIQSQQGNGGGAHDEDVLGYIVVKGVALTAADIQFVGTNDGIAKTWQDFQNLVLYYDVLADSLQPGELIVKRRGNSVPMYPYGFADQSLGHACGCGKAVCETNGL